MMERFTFDEHFNITINGETRCVIKYCITKFDDTYQAKESAMKHVFQDTTNNRLGVVLSKVIMLNEVYSTYLSSNPPTTPNEDQKYPMDVVSMALHIVANPEFDRLCQSKDFEDNIKAEEYIRKGQSDYRKAYHTEAYSFATKYCSWHNPERFPIVDKYSKGVLYYLNRELSFYKNDSKTPITQKALNNYRMFCQVYWSLQKYLKDQNKETGTRDLDKFLWYYGKKHSIELDI